MYRLLVVDDEEMIRKLIRKYAEFEGHEVTEAENGMEAVELVRRDPGAFDLAVLDVMMPELDGFSAAGEGIAYAGADAFGPGGGIRPDTWL